MYSKEIGWKDTDCTHLVHDRTRWQAVENRLSNYLRLQRDCTLWSWSQTTRQTNTYIEGELTNSDTKDIQITSYQLPTSWKTTPSLLLKTNSYLTQVLDYYIVMELTTDIRRLWSTASSIGKVHLSSSIVTILLKPRFLAISTIGPCPDISTRLL